MIQMHPFNLAYGLPALAMAYSMYSDIEEDLDEMRSDMESLRREIQPVVRKRPEMVRVQANRFREFFKHHFE